MKKATMDQVGQRLGNMAGLPKELLAQLKKKKTELLQEQIENVINDLYQGFANTDEILVGLYRKYNVIKSRAYIANKIHLMSKSGQLNPVKGKKGIYRTAHFMAQSEE